MTIELPRTIAAYFTADRGTRPGAVADCFADDAVVEDDGQTYSGRDAIRRWKAEASTKYTYTVEPFAIARDGDRTVVIAHLAGDFPGSPLNLRYRFALADEKIAALEIAA